VDLVSSELSVAIAQMNSVDDLDSNLAQIEKLIFKIFEVSNPRMIVFPENCLYMRILEGEVIQGLELSHRCFNILSKLAEKYKTYLHLGSVPLYIEGSLYNSSVLISSDGDVRASYQKCHLFDIQLDGGKPIRESDVFRHGTRPEVFSLDNWDIGQTICYDVRFAELFSQYANQNVDIIVVPAAFLVQTGGAHWEILLRARAIESQVYILASAQGGVHKSAKGVSRETYGHSMIIDPWGQIIASVTDLNEGFAIATLSKSKIESVRQQIPMKNHRRFFVKNKAL
jgi:predicted amidohydrolase